MVIISGKSLIRKATRRQRQLNLTDEQFANKINVSRSLWTQMRSFDKGIGVTFLSGFVAAFPDMEHEVLAFLRGNGNGNKAK